MKSLFCILALLLYSIENYSQNTKIKFGVQVGLNYADFRGYQIPKYVSPSYIESPAVAFLAGFNLEYKIEEKLSVKVELNYERKSQKADNIVGVIENFDEPETIYKFTSTKNYEYLVLPVMIKYCFRNKSSFFVNGGTFIGYLLKSSTENDLVNVKNNNPVDTTKLNKIIDFGLTIGLGKIIEINNKSSIFIEIRENLGLINTAIF